ncbi:MAG: hypothetical protein LWY06_16885 [Firmicutes bacterium]|nr:hypothetical protein [Bacillota bacterium]
MKLELDRYTKFILTVIAIALLLNAAASFLNMTGHTSAVQAYSENEMKITDVRSVWPIRVEITNWPQQYKVKQADM